MNGDKHKSMPVLFRWIEAFADGLTYHRRKGRVFTRTPSLVHEKRTERRRRRRNSRNLISNEIKQGDFT